ncbi:MAG: 50S ribosomal protein L14 [Microgenomates bacterium OLB22]|nr:MAG: 50S ribosomal protein L14 [Microgenomates bacterium OLB22]
MVQLRSVLQVADNSGAITAHVIGVPGKGNKKIARISDVVTVVVKKADPNGQVKKGDVAHAVVVRTRKESKRDDGSYVRFDDNACVLLESRTSKEPKGSRFFGPLAREVKTAGYNKIASLAAEIY